MVLDMVCSNHKMIIVFVLSPSLIFAFFRLMKSATWLKFGNNIKVNGGVPDGKHHMSAL